jgi:hypothetical protein
MACRSETADPEATEITPSNSANTARPPGRSRRNPTAAASKNDQGQQPAEQVIADRRPRLRLQEGIVDEEERDRADSDDEESIVALQHFFPCRAALVSPGDDRRHGPVPP